MIKRKKHKTKLNLLQNTDKEWICSAPAENHPAHHQTGVFCKICFPEKQIIQEKSRTGAT